MKQIKMAVMLMTLVLGGLTSCTKDNSGTSAVNTTNSSTGKINVKGDNTTIASLLEQGTWIISSYSDNTESGANFNGYVFTFADPNYLGAIYNGGAVFNGTFSADEGGRTVLMDFGMTPLPLSALEAKWNVLDIGSETARLQRSDGGATLTLQKVHNTY